MTVTLIRHPETALNKPGAEKIRGWVDIPLDDKGLAQSQSTAAQFGRGSVRKVYTSDLTRAATLGHLIGQNSGAPVIATYKLRPWNLGALSGRRIEDALPVMNQGVADTRFVMPGGENFDGFRNRYLPFLDHLLSESRSVGPIAVVTHSRNIQLARAWDKAGRPRSLDFDRDRMLDYRDEVPPTGKMTLT